LRIVLGALLIALAVIVGGLIRGDFGPWKTSGGPTSPSRQQVQGLAIVEAQKVVPGIVNVTCVMPTAWIPGDTFTCYGYGSSGRELAQMRGTVLPDDGDQWQMNEDWSVA
jgi:hypothetical protein